MLARWRTRNPMKDAMQRVYIEGVVVVEPDRTLRTVGAKSRPRGLSS